MLLAMRRLIEGQRLGNSDIAQIGVAVDIGENSKIGSVVSFSDADASSHRDQEGRGQSSRG
jgi:hypothetical protein